MKRMNSKAIPRLEVTPTNSTANMAASVDRKEANGNATDLNAFPSPLQRFVEAKGQVREIYVRIERCIGKILRILRENSLSCRFVDPVLLSQIEGYLEGVSQIGGMLSRDHMKVVFFGRTSNGKSTVINAMLHSKVLPYGMGHTTRCFLQVEGTSDGKRCMLKEGSEEVISLESIDKMANAFCSQVMGEDVLFRILWPKLDSRLLQNEVVLVDSPGIDVTPQFDEWIDKHCLDADVFVLVSNAEATLTNAEMNFFRRVKAKLSKPNIFILNNRWDASAAEPESMEQVRCQHTKRCLDFLVNELQVCDRVEGKNRIYFVSAREVLYKRLQRKGVSSPTSVPVIEGAEARMKEFEQFERQFEVCISKSAILTKFDSHVEKGKAICDHVYEALNALQKNIKARKEQCLRLSAKKENHLRDSKKKVAEFTANSRALADRLANEVKEQIAEEFFEQANRMELFIEYYSENFRSDLGSINQYKTALINEVNRLMNLELPERCSNRVVRQITVSERDLARAVANLLPTECSDRAEAVVRVRQAFEFTFTVPCEDLLSDFREDLQFHFSLGLSRILAKLSDEKFVSMLMYRNDDNQADAAAPSSSAVLFTGNSLMSSALVRSASLIADGGVGLLLACVVIKKMVGWPALITIVIIYELLYLYERLSWNDQTRERVFKKQFYQHLDYKMRLLEGTLVETCRHQVAREISDVSSRLVELTDEAFEVMQIDLEELNREVQLLDEFFAVITPMKNNLAMLRGDLDNFKNNHLRPYS